MHVKTKKLLIISLAAVIVITVFTMVNVLMLVDDWNRDWTENFASLQADAADPDLRVLVIPGYHDHIVKWMEQWAGETPGWEHQETIWQDGAAEVHLIHATPILRFRDDIHVSLMTVETGTLIHATSESRIGKGDLGQNPRNLKELVRALKQADVRYPESTVEVYADQL